MKSRFITLEFVEYNDLFRNNKALLNPSDKIMHYRHIPWHLIGLKFYDALPQGKRKFKILEHKMWMKYWMLTKIKG
jgi:hypothetical protein